MASDSGHQSDDEPINEFKHDRMLEAIRNIGGGKRLMASQRTEYARVSEFSLGSKVKIELNDLLGSLGKTSKLSKARTEAKQAYSRGVKTLRVPLETPEANKIERAVTYDNVCKEVSKWDRVVFQNRAAEQVVYPLNQPELRMQTSREVVQRFKLTTPLEQEVAALLESRRPAVPDPSPSEKKIHASRLLLDEAIEMRREMQIMRARQSYREAKARYQKKIKSKRYHRILKKERSKKEVKDFEALQKTNPELAEEKLDQLDRQRIEERMTLRHRNTGKWAREQIIKFKNDKQSGKAVQEQYELGRHLATKLQEPSDSEEDGDHNGETDEEIEGSSVNGGRDFQLSRSDFSNPWMNPGLVSKKSGPMLDEDDARKELLVGYRKFWEQDTKRRILEAQGRATGEVTVVEKDVETTAEHIPILKQFETKRVSWKDALESDNDSDNVDSPDKLKKIRRIKKTKKTSGIVDVGKVKKAKKKYVPEVVKSAKKLKKHSEVVKEKKSSKKCKLKEVETWDVEDGLDEVDLIFQDAAEKKKRQKMTTAIKKVKFGKNEKEKRNKKEVHDSDDVVEDEVLKRSEEESKVFQIISETLVRKRRWEDFDSKHKASEVTLQDREEVSLPRTKFAKQAVTVSATNENDVSETIDPHKFIVVKERNLKCRVADELDCYDEEAMDDRNLDEDNEEQRMAIAEAFADDDVVSEFKAEKLQAIADGKPKDIDLTLPGWGEWGGKGLDVSKQKRKRFTIKAPKGPPRKDRQMGHVILNEKAEDSVKPLQVGTVPFPFHDADDFEKNLSAPIGKQWNPETAYRLLIAPKVVTKMGAIIEPIDADFLKKHSSMPLTKTKTLRRQAKM